MADFTNSTSTTDTSATMTMSPPESGTETVQTNGDANGQGAPVEEGFTRVDPRTLPPQLRSAYDNMLRDYKEKTTKLSETVKSEAAKATEAYRQKAELYDQIASQEPFVQKWNEYVQQVQNETGKPPQEGDPVLTQMKQQLQEMNQKIQLSEMAQVTEAFAEAVDEKGQPLHPQFDELNSIVIGKVGNGEEFSLLRAAIELAPGKSPQEKLANGYKEAKAMYDRIFEAGKKAGMGRLERKVLNGTNPPSNSAGDVLSVTDKKPKNAREALEMARKGQMVSRE